MSVRALSVVPGKPETAQVGDHPDPPESDGSVLVDGLLIGICGTDVEILREGYGWAPPGEERLVIGHESLGRVAAAPPESGFAPGDLVAGIVRRPDPVPCVPCSLGAWDFCRNGQYTERGIKERHGYAASQWRIEPEFAVRLDPTLGDLGVLLEPTSVVAKAWDQAEKVAARSPAPRHVALVTGAGPIGLLAALLGVQRGYQVHVFDQVTTGPKPDLVADLGATYHTGDIAGIGVQPDVVIECTGHGPLVFALTDLVATDGVICLTGISASKRQATMRPDEVNKEMVLDNLALVGSVNASRAHYEAAAAALAKADRSWLARLITRRVPLERFDQALERQDGDVKVVLELAH
ncbi:MAG: glucose 1-dehydrogenase [Acidothermus cellulolyticus]|nr:glucose 1-dehydrogenase [Acidothermus cellulolyticus]